MAKAAYMRLRFKANGKRIVLKNRHIPQKNQREMEPRQEPENFHEHIALNSKHATRKIQLPPAKTAPDVSVNTQRLKPVEPVDPVEPVEPQF